MEPNEKIAPQVESQSNILEMEIKEATKELYNLIISKTVVEFCSKNDIDHNKLELSVRMIKNMTGFTYFVFGYKDKQKIQNLYDEVKSTLSTIIEGTGSKLDLEGFEAVLVRVMAFEKKIQSYDLPTTNSYAKNSLDLTKEQDSDPLDTAWRGEASPGNVPKDGIYFKWYSESSRGHETVVDRFTVNLWAAMKKGKKVPVKSNYGLPEPGYRGIIYTDCRCGVPFTRGVGYVITGKSGKEYVVDSIAIHNTAKHNNKLDSLEMGILADLPDCDIPCDVNELKSTLNKTYDI